MSRQFIPAGIGLAALLCAAVGCRPQQPYFFYEDGDLSHYVGLATDIEYPDVEVASLDDVQGAMAPFTLENQMLDEDKLWDLSLEEAMRLALQNSKVIRLLDPAFAPDGRLLASSQAATTIYDPALAESDPRFGVEGALSAFDAQFSTSVFWEKNDAPRNGFLSPAAPNLRSFGVFQQDTGTFQAEITKLNATGGRTTIRHNVNYDENNSNDLTRGLRQFDSDWNVNLEAEIRQPLLQGAGAQFNRIAGPGSIPGFYNGVMIARLRTDQSLTEFEMAVRDSASDVERAYWELYLRYRILDVVVQARDKALEIWQKAQARLGKAGDFEVTSETRARYEYFQFRSQVEEALNGVYQGEANLRYVMGLAPNDGRLIRPVTEPTTARVDFDWHDVQCEALSRSPELRRQKWLIKQRELELIAAKNYLLPRLDFVGRYRWTGMGDDLLNASGNPDTPAAPPATAFDQFAARFDNAYTTLTDGDFQEWQLGLELNLPFGFRREMAAVRHAQLSVGREKAVLQDQELLLVHQLSDALRELDKQYQLAQTHLNRLAATLQSQASFEALDKAGRVGALQMDIMLDGLQRAVSAGVSYHSAVVAYNQAIRQVHLRKGSLLEYNGVYLAEGPWPPKAYFDAHRLARQRDASFYLDYGFTRPKVLSRGPYAQHAGAQPMFSPDTPAGTPVKAPPHDGPVREVIPTPEPEPTGPSPASDSSADPASLPPRRPGLTAAGPITAAQLTTNRSSAGRDLANLDLDTLAGPGNQAEKEPVPTGTTGRSRQDGPGLIHATARPPSPSNSAVRRATYDEPAAGRPKGEGPQHDRAGAWNSSRPSHARTPAPVNPPPAETESPGWRPRR